MKQQKQEFELLLGKSLLGKMYHLLVHADYIPPVNHINNIMKLQQELTVQCYCVRICCSLVFVSFCILKECIEEEDCRILFFLVHV
jgi:hypothetical protein